LLAHILIITPANNVIHSHAVVHLIIAARRSFPVYLLHKIIANGTWNYYPVALFINHVSTIVRIVNDIIYLEREREKKKKRKRERNRKLSCALYKHLFRVFALSNSVLENCSLVEESYAHLLCSVSISRFPEIFRL